MPLPVGAPRAATLLERVAGPSVFATWEEAELMEESMTTPRGDARTRARLGVEPKPMREVLGLGLRGLAAALVEVELGQRGARDVGRHLLCDLEVARADGDVVERHDADERVRRPSPAGDGSGG